MSEIGLVDHERRSRLPRALVALGLRRPKATLAIWALLCSALAPGVALLRVETSTDSVLEREGQEWAFYQSSQERFGGDEVLTLLVAGDSPFDPETMRRVVRLTKRLQEVDGVWRVDSLATIPLVRVSDGSTLILEAALANGVPDRPRALKALRLAIEADRIAPRALVSSDGRSFAVNVVLEPGAERFYDGILAEIRSLEEPADWISGVPVFRIEADSRTRAELLTFVPLTVSIIAVLMWAIFGSWRAIALSLLPSATGCWITAGIMGATGAPISIATVLLPSILLALGSAYSMHLISAGAGRSGLELESALRKVALPVALSGLTTSIGFASIAAVRIAAIRDVGAFGALGVLVVLATTLSAVPALLRLLPIHGGGHALGHWLSGVAPERLTRLIQRRGRLLLAGWVGSLVVVGFGVANVRVETDVIEWFQRSDPIRVAYEEIRTRLSGISPMNVVVETTDGSSTVDAEVLAAIDRLSSELDGLPEVGKAISVADPLRQMHGGFLGDDSNPLPGDDSLIEQYLLLLESKPYVRDLVTSDRAAANIVLRVDDNGSDALLRVARLARERWSQYGPESADARVTGIMHEFARAQDEIARGQLIGLAIAISSIAFVLVAIFRSMKLALLALLPNAIPVFMAFGVMGLVGIPLDAGTVILGSLALGIAVDDTVHVTEGFVTARLEGAGPPEALRLAFSRVIRPVVYTTIVVASGFLVLTLSDFTLTRNLGFLTAGTMFLCLATDLLLLPVLLLRSNLAFRGSKAD